MTPTFENDYLLCSIAVDDLPVIEEEMESSNEAQSGPRFVVGEGVDAETKKSGESNQSSCSDSANNAGGDGVSSNAKEAPVAANKSKSRYTILPEDPPLIGEELSKDPTLLEELKLMVVEN